MNFTLRIPDYYKSDIELLKGKVSTNQFIVNAVAEKIASLKTLSYLEERAAKGSTENALEILGNAPEVEPAEWDKL